MMWSLIWLSGRIPARTNSSFVDTCDGKTRPGQSHNTISSPHFNVWKCFVFPGVADTDTFLSCNITFMQDDFPTFG